MDRRDDDLVVPAWAERYDTAIRVAIVVGAALFLIVNLLEMLGGMGGMEGM